VRQRPDTERLFLALWPTPTVRAALTAQQSLWRWPAAALCVEPAALHLTLHFIGPVPRARLQEVAQGLARPCPRLTLVLDRCELWPNRCAMLRPGEVPEALCALHAALAEALQGLALPVERRALRPHVTLARHAAGALPPERPEAFRWTVRGYALVASAGGHYTPIARYP
jgi:2'-5' RNA ligase